MGEGVVRLTQPLQHHQLHTHSQPPCNHTALRQGQQLGQTPISLGQPTQVHWLTLSSGDRASGDGVVHTSYDVISSPLVPVYIPTLNPGCGLPFLSRRPGADPEAARQRDHSAVLCLSRGT